MLFKKYVRICLMSFRLLVLFSMLATPALAEGNRPVITIEPLRGIGVGLNIVFPEDVSAEQIAPNTMYCTGTLRPSQTVYMKTYDGTSLSVTFTAAVTGPALNGETEPRPDPCPIAARRDQLGGFKLASSVEIPVNCIVLPL